MALYYEALRARALDNGHKYHMLSVLTRGKSVIRISTNSTKTHPKYRRIYCGTFECHTLHAEMAALIRAQPGDDLQVFHFHKDGSLNPSLPCIHCMEAIIKAGIKTLTYMDKEGEWTKLKLRGTTLPKGYLNRRNREHLDSLQA